MVKTVLAIFAHPDDAELTCFGTLSKLSRKNYRVVICIATNGEAGLGPDETNQRIEEAQNAADIIGATLEIGNFPDGSVAHDRFLLTTIELWMKKYNPEIIITHAPEPERAGHQDHVSVSTAVSNAVARLRNSRLLLFAEPPKPSQNFHPNLIVDISSHAQIKQQAILLHRSQIKKWYFSAETIALRSKWWLHSLALCQDDEQSTSVTDVEAFQIDKAFVSDTPTDFL